MTQKSTSRFFKRAARRLLAITVTSGVFVIAGGAIWQGQNLIAERASAVEKPLATEALLVQSDVLRITDGYDVSRSFTGQLEALKQADLSFERGGTLADVLVEEGAAIAKGDLIARLDGRLLEAEIERLKASKRALEAQLELAMATDMRKAELLKQGFATAQTTDETRLTIVELNARIAELEAGLVAARINLEKAELRAPFDGKINKRLLDPGSTVGGGQAVLTVVETSDPVFRVGIDPALAASLKSGDPLKVTIDGSNFRGSVLAVLPELDAGTRTSVVRVTLPDAHSIALGSTGIVTLLQNAGGEGAWVPLTALEDGIRGLWTLKTLSPDLNAPDAKATVSIAAVEIVYAEQDRAFVRGTFADGEGYIKEGVHRVVSGQAVRVENEGGE